MTARKPAWFALENGLVIEGTSLGAEGERGGDLVFNTAMSGYHEILTDPSYAGQVVLMTYPLIGNYGIAEEDAESARAWPEGFVVKQASSIASSHRSTQTLQEFLKAEGIVGIEGVDTRRLVKLTRELGSLRCIISTTDSDPESLVAKAKAMPSTTACNLAAKVTCKEPYTWDESYPDSYPVEITGATEPRLSLVAYDFGIKRNILRSLVHCGFDVTVVPAGTSATDVLARKPDAVFLSNGPGDPEAVTSAIQACKELVGKVPIFGICLGHQILCLAQGAQTYKMPFGHHGANHPVLDETTDRVEITSQNHSYAVDASSIPDCLEVTHVNLNDQTVAGVRHKQHPVFSVQYHPEACPGPHDPFYLFDRFRSLIEGIKV
ncbi:MAG: glutamine-hydrolyzing carbamoyl-phosphate synthase small subunit [Desulfocapsa sp.]|nr:glutamine-hydrolyzing carbamoyl-phosphate synthase small subunit [Desulfocapsa sp.]